MRTIRDKQKHHTPALLGGQPMFEKIVPITTPTMPPLSPLFEKYKKILKSGMLTNFKYVQEFEEAVKEYTGAPYAVATNSCMNGMMLIMRIFGLKGEVIIPSFTFHATGHAVVWNGLTPVFVECDPETYNIDPRKVEEAITPRTSAILAVHMFGNPVDIQSLEDIAKRHKLKLIFDAAHAFGSKYRGQSVGLFGDAESFSLSPTKLLTTAEGGVVTTRDPDLAKKLRTGRTYGDPGTYDSEFSGFNARMSELHAALGLTTIPMLEKNVIRRNKIVELYKKRLSKLPGLRYQKIAKDDRCSFKDFSIYIEESEFGFSRNQLFDALAKENIMAKKYFHPPLHFQQAFQAYVDSNLKLPITEKVSNNSISLPLFSHMSEETVGKICDAVSAIHIHADKIPSA